VAANHHVRDVNFTEDPTNRTSHGPIDLATIRNAVSNAIWALATSTSPKAGATTHQRSTPSTSTAR
jgi:hypothetical protein